MTNVRKAMEDLSIISICSSVIPGLSASVLTRRLFVNFRQPLLAPFLSDLPLQHFVYSSFNLQRNNFLPSGRDFPVICG